MFHLIFNTPNIKKNNAMLTNSTQIPPIGTLLKSLALIIKPEAHTAMAKNGMINESQLKMFRMKFTNFTKPSF